MEGNELPAAAEAPSSAETVSFMLQWPGWPLNQVPSAESLLETNPWVNDLREAEIGHLMAFYEGDQWDPAVKQHRIGQLRCVLTINRLPAIVARALANSARESSTFSDGDLERLKLIVTRWNLDAQKAHNFMVCAAVEYSGAMAASAKVTMRPAESRSK